MKKYGVTIGLITEIQSAADLDLLEIKGVFWPSIDEIIKTTHEPRVGCNLFEARTRSFPTIASKRYHHINLLVTKPEPLIYRLQIMIKRVSRSAINLTLCCGWNNFPWANPSTKQSSECYRHELWCWRPAGPVLCSRDIDVTLSWAGDRSVEPGVTSINCLAFLHTTHNNKEYIHLAFNYLPFV